MSGLTPEMQAIKERMKAVWSAGDFGVVAQFIDHEGDMFIERLNIKPGSKVLDVACGTGNLALPAARLGANVTGIDLVEDLIRQAKERTKAENLNVKFEVGDAEDLPYSGNEFDYVVTMFGAMFAPRPEVAAKELLRVTKPGGKIAMANWTPTGYVGEFFKLGASYAPPPPGAPAPALWGDEETVKQRFGDKVSKLELNRFMCRQNLPMSPHEAADHFITYFGPTKILWGMLDDGKREQFKKEFINLWTTYNMATDGNTMVDAEYLMVVATKA
ncbi:MAG TPA: class I SAM-dependent methyltransferase [Ignavibacteria bacterium]|jgi:SAM-dependent methyltransferase